MIKSTAVILKCIAFVFSTSAVRSEADTIEQSVSKLKKDLNKATTNYVYPPLNGELVPSSELYPTLNTLKKDYQNTRRTLVYSTIPKNEKKAILKDIDTLYEEKITRGLIGYIDAYNYEPNTCIPY